MSLKAKLEAVIYAADEPVTLTQLAQIFAADALEWQAARAAAAAEANADVVGGEPASPESGTLLSEDLEVLPLADTTAQSAQTGEQAGAVAMIHSAPLAETGSDDQSGADEAEPMPGPEVSNAEPEAADQEHEAVATPGPGETAEVDPEAEARRLARQRDREIKSILKQILDEIIASFEHDDRGVEIREIAGGYRMATKPECHDAVRLFVKSLKPPLKLSLPALETLAVVAYKQPVTAPEVSEIRGVESGGVLGSLLARKLIATAGRKQVIGRPILYKTTKEFLLRFGLKDLNELPSMEEFEKMAAAEIEEMEPEAVAADAAQAALEAAEAAEPGAETGMEAAVVAALTAGPDEEPDQEPEPQSVEGAAGDGEERAELSGNSPSALELAESEAGDQESEQASPDRGGDGDEASQIPAESSTDVTSAEPSMTSNEQDAANEAAADAPPAEPEPTAPAENEANPHAEENEEERGV